MREEEGEGPGTEKDRRKWKRWEMMRGEDERGWEEEGEKGASLLIFYTNSKDMEEGRNVVR